MSLLGRSSTLQARQISPEETRTRTRTRTQPNPLAGTNAINMHLAGARLLVQIISSGYRATSLRIQRMPNPSHHGWRTGVNQSDSSEAFWQEYLYKTRNEDLYFERE